MNYLILLVAVPILIAITMIVIFITVSTSEAFIMFNQKLKKLYIKKRIIKYKKRLIYDK